MLANYESNSISIFENSIGSTTLSASPISTSGEEGIIAYPNPFEDHISFDFTTNDYSNIEIDIYDITGKKVKATMHAQVYEGEKITLNMSSLSSSGFYFYIIRSNKEQIYTGKILRK